MFIAHFQKNTYFYHTIVLLFVSGAYSYIK